MDGWKKERKMNEILDDDDDDDYNDDKNRDEQKKDCSVSIPWQWTFIGDADVDDEAERVPLLWFSPLLASLSLLLLLS